MTVIDLQRVKDDREPHNFGSARCMNCRHEWNARSPIGTDWLECPDCHLMKGLYLFPFWKAERQHWFCNCGNDLFHITKDGSYCPNCGDWCKFP